MSRPLSLDELMARDAERDAACAILVAVALLVGSALMALWLA